MKTITLPNLYEKENLTLAKAAGEAIIKEFRLPASRKHSGCYRIGKDTATPAAISRTLMSLIRDTCKNHENTTTTTEHTERRTRQAR